MTDLIIKAILLYWVLISAFAIYVLLKTFRKFANVKIPEQYDHQKYGALIRTDFQKWDKKFMILGSFTIFPIKFAFTFSFLIGALLFAAPLAIFGQRKIINDIFTLYLNTYGKLVTRVLIRITENYENKQILSPIVIANHTNWFDIFFLTLGNAPMSFLAKAEIQKWPIIGSLAKARMCIMITRESSGDRKMVSEEIKERIDGFNNKDENCFPLAIFPEGTTSNGKGLLTFKRGAFQNLSSITAFCFNYHCKNFDMGMDMINVIEFGLMMMCQYPTLLVNKIQFSPNQGETAEQYENRCRVAMANKLGYVLTDGGYRDKMVIYKQIVKMQGKQQ